MYKLIISGLLMATLLSACNTFHGVGQDISHLGSVISHAAN